MRASSYSASILALLGCICLGCGPGAPRDTTSGKTPITGVWAFVSETNTETGELVRDDSTWKGIWVFTEGFHCLARMDAGRQSLSEAELEALPPGEQIAYYQQLLEYSSTSGTYSIDGNTLRRRWEISLGPGIIGHESVTEFSVESDRLTVDLPRRSADSGPAVRVVYRRLE